MCEGVILNPGRVPEVSCANIYMYFIKNSSWILARLWNCMLSKEEGLKIIKEKRLMGGKGKQDKNRPEKGRNKWLCVGMSLPCEVGHAGLQKS